MDVVTSVVLAVGTFLFALAISAAYLRHASRHGPYATPNFRSLHQKVIPRGAGLAVAAATLASYGALWLSGHLSTAQALVYLVGGSVVALVGAADDRLDIHAKYRFPFQVLAACYVTACFGALPPLNIHAGPFHLRLAIGDLGLLGQGLLVCAFVWFYNLYNFIDGIDGMASSAAVYLCAALSFLLYLRGARELAMIVLLLAVASGAFLFFNWSPARMFLGDAGSSFMSFVLSGVFVESLRVDPSLLWAWLIIGAFYFSDTTLTTLVRILKVPGWYKPHRSHAYQNLARIWANHRKVVLLVLAIDLCWLLPLLCVAERYPASAPLVVLVAYVPVCAFCLKYGPLFENK